MSSIKKSWVYGVLLGLTLVINAMGAMGIINGLSQKEISDMYMTLITPSPSTFSIWSVIYTLIIVSVIVMIVKDNDEYFKKAVNELTILFPLSFIFNALWIVSFSYVQIELSVIFIFGLMITLSLICKKLLKIQEKRRWLLPLTFGLYTGWLFIATVVNISAALVKIQWNGFGISTEILAIATLIVATLIVIGVQFDNENAAFTLPVAWALWGINQYLVSPEGFAGAFRMLEVASLGLMIILIVFSVMRFVKNKLSILPVK